MDTAKSQVIAETISRYLSTVKTARSEHTARTYANALSVFSRVFKERWLDPDTTPTDKLNEDAIAWLAGYLKNFASATERLYLTAVTGFYEYLAAERLAEINLPRLRLLIRQRARRPGIRLPQFPAEDIERMLGFISDPSTIPHSERSLEDVETKERLREIRDRAFLLTLADTGLGDGAPGRG